jgi:REP element-mobilizing transposase RayT
MARKWSNINIPGALHYVTGNIRDRVPIFTRDDCATEFFKVLGELRSDWPAKVISYVVMPEHFHFIVNPRDGAIKGFTQALKSKLAIRIVELTGDKFLVQRTDNAPYYQVWQESFKAIPLWSAWMIWQKINYIHANPVKARLVKSVKDYRWSSARVIYAGATEPLVVDQDWWWPDDAEKISKAMKELGWRTYHHRASDK